MCFLVSYERTGWGIVFYFITNITICMSWLGKTTPMFSVNSLLRNLLLLKKKKKNFSYLIIKKRWLFKGYIDIFFNYFPINSFYWKLVNDNNDNSNDNHHDQLSLEFWHWVYNICHRWDNYRVRVLKRKSLGLWALIKWIKIHKTNI